MARRINEIPTMPFGKYKGVEISALPTEYLRWAIEQDWISPWLSNLLRSELTTRGQIPQDRQYALALEIITAGRRMLALRYHPDRGGDPETMRDVNAVADHLIAMLGSMNGTK